MTKKTRTIILVFCITCFFAITPLLVGYSMGYRIDWEQRKVVSTGGIYVRTFPDADNITIDSKISQKPGFLNNWVFVQSLLPKSHTVLVTKDGYFDYRKTLPVEEREVTKLEDILLIKKDVTFTGLADKVQYFSIAPDNKNVLVQTAGLPAQAGKKGIDFAYYSLPSSDSKKTFSITTASKVNDTKWADSDHALLAVQTAKGVSYYLFDNTKTGTQIITSLALDQGAKQISFNPLDLTQLFYIKGKSLNLLKAGKSTKIIDNVAAYRITGTQIEWLSGDGLLFKSDFTGKQMEQENKNGFKLAGGESYELAYVFDKTILKQSNSVFTFDNTTKTFKTFFDGNYNLVPSPDGKNLAHFNNAGIYVYSREKDKSGLLYRATSKISNVFWINNSYVIFTDGTKAMVSEIDYRGNVNVAQIMEKANLQWDSQMFYNSHDGKVYALANGELIASEKIIP